jgi:hypothetical protein
VKESNVCPKTPFISRIQQSVLLKVINTELQFVFFDSVWATEARPSCRVNEIKHLRNNFMKCGLALVLGSFW